MENLDVVEEKINLEDKATQTPSEEKSVSFVKDFFVKESLSSTKELASLFGQSEFELQKEFRNVLLP